MGDEINKTMKVGISIFCSLCYCYFVSSNIPKGKPRLLSLLPVMILFVLIPLLLSYLFPIAITALFISWLANFKLLLYAFDQGPLPRHPSMSLLPFIAMVILPLRIKPQGNHTSPKLPLNWPIKVFLFAIFVSVHEYKSVVHPSLVVAAYCCMASLLVDILFGASNYIVRAASDVELLPPSDEPYLATSLRDFWGRRWNLTVTSTLRHTVYRPVRSLLEGPLGRWARLPAVLATFLVSGLMHELLFYYVTRVGPTWEVTGFFLLHGACLVVESGLKGLVDRKLQLHWMVSAPLTVGFVMATAAWLFFPPLVRSGATDEAVEECKMAFNFMKEKLKFGR